MPALSGECPDSFKDLSFLFSDESLTTRKPACMGNITQRRHCSVFPAAHICLCQIKKCSDQHKTWHSRALHAQIPCLHCIARACMHRAVSGKEESAVIRKCGHRLELRRGYLAIAACMRMKLFLQSRFLKLLIIQSYTIRLGFVM